MISEVSWIISIFTILISLAVVLTERKFLAYAQRRMGPAIMGRNGAGQLALDLLKLLTKEIFFIPRPTAVTAPIFLSLLYAVQVLFSQNFIFSPSGFLFDNLDSLILYHLVLVLLGNILLVLIGLLSQSRYAILGSVRSLIHVMSLDIFVTILYSLLIFTSQSANFHDFVFIQNNYWFFFLYFPAASGFIIILLLESKRAPFDHAETEAEVVAGYAVEYSGPMLLMFYLAEYLHLVISSIHFILFFWGGWILFKLSFIFPPIFLIPNDVNIWLFLYF